MVYKFAVGKKLPAGEHILFWDGCNDEGNPVPIAKYTFKGLTSNLRSVWDGKIGNTSPSDKWEYLQYRTGHYCDVIAMPDGGLLSLSMWGEHSRIIQYINGTEGYPVRWSSGQCSVWLDYLVAGAVDGDYLYGVRSRNAGNGKRYEVIKKWSLKDGVRPPPDNDVVLNKPHGATGALLVPGTYLPGYKENPNNPIPFAGVVGLAAHAGKLYVPLLIEDRVAVYDIKNMKEISSFSCPSPRKIAISKTGEIYVTSENQVLRFNPYGSRQMSFVSGLDTPWGITVAPDGNIYVTECGNTQQLKIYNSKGKLLKTFGKKGGHKGGLVSPNLLEMPLSVSVNNQGHIFIADFGGQRVLVLNSDFTLRKIIHGRMHQHALSVSELDRSLLYSTFVRTKLWEYKIDYDKHVGDVSKLLRRWNFIRFYPEMKRFSSNRIYFRKWNGRVFGIQPGEGILVFEMVGDQIVSRSQLGLRRYPWQKTGPKQEWVWRDQNGDGIMQTGEIKFGDWQAAASWFGGYVDEIGNIYIPSAGRVKGTLYPRGVLKIPFQGLDKSGLPIYSWGSAKWILKLTDKDERPGLDGKLYNIQPSSYMQDKAGNMYISDCGDGNSYWTKPKKDLCIFKYDPNGKRVWKAGQKQRNRSPLPGDMRFCAFPSGLVSDKYLFYVDYTGSINCWDTDGLWVGRLFSDLPEELKNEGECFNGLVFRHPNGKVYAFSAPDCTYRISRIVVEGLDDIERFQGAVMVNKVATPRKAEKAGLPLWQILHTRGKIDIDGTIDSAEWGTRTDTQAPVDFERGDKNVARCWAQWDEKALYIAWDIKDKSPAMNKSLGKVRWAGDQVELMIRVEPGAVSKSARGKHTATEYQIEIGTDGNNRLGAYVLLNGSSRKGKFLSDAKVGLKINENKSGYTMETMIPWASLGDYRPKKGDKIPWNMKIHWSGPDGKGVSYISQWAPGLHTLPKTWGTAIFQ